MSIPGLQVKDSGGRIMVQYMDILQLDLSALMSRMFDRAFGPEAVTRDNVVPINFKEKDDADPR